MTWVLAGVAAALAVAVVLLACLVWRLGRRLEELESRLKPSSDAHSRQAAPPDVPLASLDAEPADFVITELGPEAAEPVPTVEPRLFGDIVLRETVVQAASLFHGLRRALSQESRNRIGFEMKREVRRSRKQRRADLREARREWEARQRAGIRLDAEDSEEDSAA